ncbi:hypothetical protein LZ578_06515 [Jeotgalibaca sp. MA1X17-3]|uniref:hypothetical protein n=1 Tax=Jeotgalibaca sp. MA1X17-3 TaxID=2908211 RepID=UPI001F17046F|nr:hypothetical protein [Jeotgalibaca sp. MA1X17-3]UJF14690.1 hypothetical protein LZ578_06515 [Jeotgalibaca sp. MA1X17-3]
MKKIIVVGLCTFLLASCGELENADIGSSSIESSERANEEEQLSESLESEVTSEEESKMAELPYVLNEPVGLIFEGSEDVSAEVVVTNVTDNPEAFPDYIKNGDYFDVNKLILISVDYKNISYPENLSFGLHDFQVFNENGKLLPNISQQNGGDPVAQGRSGSSEFYIETEEPQNKIELDFVPSGSNNVIATYAVDVEH